MHESIRPLKLIKSALKKMTSSSDLRHNILNTVIGLSKGCISKRLLLGSRQNPIKI